MFKKKENKEEDTMATAIVDISKGMKELVGRMDKLEKKPVEPVTEPVKPEVAKPVIKNQQPTYIVHDQPVKTKRIILDITNEENPIVYDRDAAIAEILNKLTKIEKSISG